MLGKHIETFVQKVFKRQRSRAERDEKMLNRNTSRLTQSFDSLPLEKQRELLQNEAVRSVINFGKQEADRRHDGY